LSAASMVTRNAGDKINADDEQGTMTATCVVGGSQQLSPSVPKQLQFNIVAEATTSGVSPIKSSVRVQGRIVGQRVMIDYTYHSQ
jgi:hypothetical protein